MNKHFCISLLILIITVNMFPVCAQNTVVEPTAVLVLNGLNIVNANTNEDLSKKVTRGQLAHILYRLFVYDQQPETLDTSGWNNNFFGNMDTELKTPVANTSEEIIDIHKNHVYYEEINYVISRGLMTLLDNGTFGVDTEVTYYETLKIMLDIMGYGAVTQNSAIEYSIFAANLRITLPKNNSDIMTMGELVTLIYKCFNANIMEMVVAGTAAQFKVSKEKTLLSEVLGLNIIQGIMSDNGITDFLGKSTLSPSSVKVGGYILNIDQQLSYVREFIGREVVCYYTNENRDSMTRIVYAFATNKLETQFDLRDFCEISKNSISYRTQAGSIINVNLDLGYKVILNGYALETVNASTFNFDYGKVILTQTGEGKGTDLIIVDAYKSCFINGVDQSERILFNALSSEGYETIRMDQYDHISIVDTEGNPMSFSQISKSVVVDISAGGKSIKMIVVQNSDIEFTVDSTTDDDGREIITDKEVAYYLTKSLTNRKTDLTVGNNYTVYQNNNGEIAWIEIGTDSKWEVGYLPMGRITNNTMSNQEIKIFTTNGNFKIYELYKNVLFSDTKGVAKTLKGNQIFQHLSGYQGIIRYKTKGNSITRIEFALEYGLQNNSEDRLYTIYEDDNEIMHNGRSFGGVGFLDSNTIVFALPVDKGQNDAYKISDYQLFKNQDKLKWTAFGVNANSLISKYIICEKNSTTVFGDNSPALVVTKISKVLDEDGMEIYKISGLSARENNPTDILVNSEKVNISAIKAPISELSETYKLEIGDIIRFTTDINGLSDYIEIVFDANGKNPITGQFTGWICGSDGYAPVIDEQRIANPYVVTHDGDLRVDQYVGYTQNVGFRIIYGYVYNYRDGIITITTQNLNESAYAHGDTQFFNENYQLTSSNVVYLNYNDNVLKPIKGSLDSIKDYKNFGQACSRAVIMTNYGEVKNAFIFDGFTK